MKTYDNSLMHPQISGNMLIQSNQNNVTLNTATTMDPPINRPFTREIDFPNFGSSSNVNNQIDISLNDTVLKPPSQVSAKKQQKLSIKRPSLSQELPANF